MTDHRILNRTKENRRQYNIFKILRKMIWQTKILYSVKITLRYTSSQEKEKTTIFVRRPALWEILMEIISDMMKEKDTREKSGFLSMKSKRNGK